MPVDATLPFGHAGDDWGGWDSTEGCSHNKVLRLKGSTLLATLVDLHSPAAARRILVRFDDCRAGPDVELQGGCVPFHEETHLLSRSVGGPLFGIGEVWKMVGPVREVEREVFIAFPPDLANNVGFLDDQGGDSQGLEVGGDHQTAVMVLSAWGVRH